MTSKMFSFPFTRTKPPEAQEPVIPAILTDGLLLTRWYITYRLDQEMERARRYQRPLSVVLATPAVLPGEQLAEQALASGAAAARAAARSTDLAGWMDGSRILIVMPETTHALARVAIFRWRNEIMVRTARKWWFAVIEDAGKYEGAEELLQAATEQLVQRDCA